MTIHLLRPAVGIRDIAHLEQVQKEHREKWKGKAVDCVYTRNAPKRQAELLDGGSLYRIIKGVIACRQEILGFDEVQDEGGKRFCRIILRPGLIRTLPQAKKPFQGWRYLASEAAPKDLPTGTGKNMKTISPGMAKDLNDLGLL